MSNEVKMVGVARELAVRIEQILTGGHGAEAWAPTIVELRAALAAEQRQGEPKWGSILLDLEVIREAVQSPDSDQRLANMDAAKVLRRAIDLLKAMRGTHPAPAVQKGEPELWRYRKSAVRSWLYTEHKATADMAWRDGYIVENFYTHPDAGEVERLRYERKRMDAALVAATEERDRLRADLDRK